MMKATGQLRNRQARFAAVVETTAEWRLWLPPFAGCANGWTGSISQFLAQIRDGTLLLECVPLASVVDQYITHINHLDLQQAGEFLDITASLIQCKSRLMLPSDPFLSDVGEDPRQEILRELGDGERRRREGKAARANAAEKGNTSENSSELSLLDLFVLLNEVEQTLLADSSYQVSVPPVTVADQLQWLSQWFAHDRSTVDTTDSLFLLHSSKQTKVCLFLALLEMVKRGQLCLDQSVAFGAIAVHPFRAQNPRQLTDQ
jgi:segregation and condensation protein A